jgi:predicted phosphodiesterase
VQKLRAQEANDYDVVAVAGDIGTARATDIFATLATFGCPVVYVNGNWDRVPDGVAYGPNIHLVHLEVVMVGGVVFAGYS